MEGNRHASTGGMTPIASGCVALVVAETDKLGELGRAAVEKLSKAGKLRSQRAVKEASRGFGKTVAANPSCLDVYVVLVVGFTPAEPSVYDFEPIVVHEGKLQRVTGTYLMVAGSTGLGRPTRSRPRDRRSWRPSRARLRRNSPTERLSSD